MIKRIRDFLLVALCVVAFNSSADSDDPAQDALNSLKDAADMAGKFVDGMVGSFGYVDPAYVNSFKVINDTAQEIGVARRTDLKILGASFSGDVGDRLKLAPYTDSGDFYTDKHLNFTVLIEQSVQVTGLGAISKILFEKGVPLTVKNDTNTYYYRAYENRGQIRIEYLGVKSMTPAFSGVFYNSFPKPVKLSFIKDGQNYTVTLEPNTFNLLNSTPDNSTSIRPGAGEHRNFTFTDGTTTVKIPITAQGVCNMVLDDKTQQLVPGTPMVYTYEVYSNNGVMAVSSQGLAIGNYTEPVDPQKPDTSLVRDINPISAQVWYQSLAQTSASAGAQPPSLYPMPGQVWALYFTTDQTIAQKLTAGAVQKLTLIRPLLSKKQAILSIVALESTDDAKAKIWIDRFAKGTIGSYQMPVSTTQFDPSQAVVNQAPTDYGIVDDTQGTGSSGIKGRVLLSDVFLSQGIGQGPFYYTVQQPIIYPDSLVNTLASVIDSKTYGTSTAEAIIKELTTQVTDWIKMYGGNGAAAKSALISYLQVHGIPEIFNAGSKNLNLQGQRFVDAFTTGALSLMNLPIVYQGGVNNFVFSLDKKPDNWPTAS
jgi:hypothetical protein